MLEVLPVAPHHQAGLLLQDGKHRDIIVTHVDTPGNDWNQLCRTINAGGGSYLAASDHVWGHASARSFYEQVAPSASISLAYSGVMLLLVRLEGVHCTGLQMSS